MSTGERTLLTGVDNTLAPSQAPGDIPTSTETGRKFVLRSVQESSSLYHFLGAFHIAMGAAICLLAIVTVAGCMLTDIRSPELAANWFSLIALAAMILPLPVYWYEKGRRDLMDAALLLTWALLEAIIVPYTVRACARLRMPLRDDLFGRADQFLGVHIPSIMAWSRHTWLGTAVNTSYAWVIFLMPVAVLLPVLTGKRHLAKRFVAANLISFVIGLPLFALAPAVGPWRYFHFAPSPLQWSDCEAPLLALRLPGPYMLEGQSAGIVCFPSFHVVWAVLCASVLSQFRYARIPAYIVCAMIILSTMTTGWHYFADVLGGLAIAALSLFIVRLVSLADSSQVVPDISERHSKFLGN